MDRRIMDIMLEEMQPIKQVAGFFPNVIFQPLYEGAIRAGRERGGNALGISADGPLTSKLPSSSIRLFFISCTQRLTQVLELVCLLTVKWTDQQNDDAMNAFVQRWIQLVQVTTTRAGSRHRWLYINYAYHQQDPFAGYGQHNKQRLISVQNAIDPQGVFTSRGLCRGYFKLQ
jgi:hypothetical protein